MKPFDNIYSAYIKLFYIIDTSYYVYYIYFDANTSKFKLNMKYYL